MNVFKSISEMDMSKKFATVVLLVWIASVTISFITNNVNPVMEYVQAGFMTVLISYFGKSAIEFVTRVAGKVPTTNLTNQTKNNDINGSV